MCMKYILPLILFFLTIISTLSASTYVTNSGATNNILTTTAGLQHSYSGTDLEPRVNLLGTSTYNIELSGADLTSAKLVHANLAYANLAYAKLAYANLTDANLPAAKLNGANLRSANFSRANLTHANLNRADLTHADLTGTVIRFANLSSANLTNTDLTDAYFGYTDLTGANFEYANLEYANLEYANLKYANFSSTDLTYTTITGAQFIEKANWTNAILEDAILPSGYDKAWFEDKGAIFVPEPSSYGLLFGGLTLGLVTLRRRLGGICLLFQRDSWSRIEGV